MSQGCRAIGNPDLVHFTKSQQPNLINEQYVIHFLNLHLKKKRTICKNLRACIHLRSCRIHAIDISHHVCIISHLNNISSIVCAHKFITLPETNSKSTWKWISLECKPFLFGQKAYFHLVSRAKSSFSRSVCQWPFAPPLPVPWTMAARLFRAPGSGQANGSCLVIICWRKLGQPVVVIFYGFKNTRFDQFANGHLFVARLTYRYIPGRSGFHIFGECTIQQTKHG